MGDALTHETLEAERTHGHRRRTRTIDPEQRESYLAGSMSVVEKARQQRAAMLSVSVAGYDIADVRPLFGKGGA
jgi:hypothetical protein